MLLSMSASLWTTGAFHEDGFADTCDGFGGDWSKEDILRIMKDSRLGAYGVIGILLVLLLKYNALLSLPVKLVPPALIAGHATSRLLPVLAIASMRYVRQDQTSKARPVAGGISLWQVIIAAIFALLPMLLLDPPLWLALISVTATALWLTRLFRHASAATQVIPSGPCSRHVKSHSTLDWLRYGRIPRPPHPCRRSAGHVLWAVGCASGRFLRRGAQRTAPAAAGIRSDLFEPVPSLSTLGGNFPLPPLGV